MVNRSKRLQLIGVGLLTLCLCLLFGWATVDQSRTDWMETRATRALEAAIKDTMSIVPRVQVHDALCTPSNFYVPDMLYLQFPNYPTPSNSPSLSYNPMFRGARLLVYRDLLIDLSQDNEMPPFKVTAISLSTDYTRLDASMTIKFVEFGWVIKTISAYISRMPMPRFRASTGSYQYPVGRYKCSDE